ncbi:hypothetical protein [Nocardia sp. NPDC048505]|uniref:hypothetical protein n=1 Tax=unclassified Nocardia TaxID=2637762 RepID=UPI0033E0B8E9
MGSIAISPMAWTDLIDPVARPIAGIEPLTGPIAAAAVCLERMIGRGGDTQARRVPSAGATYPYEILLTAGGSGALAVVDPARRQVVVRAADDFPLAAGEYHCLLVGRPWLSMRKYGPRGYLYHLLDCGHAVFNLALLSADDAGAQSVTAPELDLPRDAILGDVLAAGRVPLSEPPPDGAGDWRLVRVDDGRIQAGRTAFEKWADRISPAGPEDVVRFDRVRTVPRHARDAVGSRRSAAAFVPGVAAEVLNAVVAEAITDAHSVLAQLGLRWPGVRVLSRSGIGANLPDGDLLTGLGGQEQLLGADAFLVLSAPRGADQTIDGPRQSLLIAAGVVGQAVYLSATRHGVAVTGIGGIEPEFWNRALEPGRQALYLLGLGRAVDGTKRDALYPGAHG